MSLMSNGFHLAGSILRTNLITKVIPVRFIHPTILQQVNEKNSVGQEKPQSDVSSSKDRSKVIPVETSIRYLKSNAYKETYGNFPVWKHYRRNHKGQFPPQKTRKTCIRNNIVSTGSPCPICRDEYLVLDYVNIELLKQFISEHNGKILSYKTTGLCQKSHNNLLVAVHKAKEYGLLTFDVPFRQYDYSEWKSS
ncbi:PREDICTED: 28S ribosomal protein S18b, mitochondrial [Dufourea novaeangliae]|uniref:28S ribosomal protein S18b, mitochondrial n=1 Tax=Dufourea novaeangliae TaxID=178035 RepID=UPI00076784B7|nr:PREDICTED: 28S ribosomal protein S18b, mitochondrial [Dufourea novaeangliae]